MIRETELKAGWLKRDIQRASERSLKFEPEPNMASYDYNGHALTAREKVNILEAEMRKQPQIELEIKHHFSYGIYGREMFIPKGVMLTGKIHKTEQMSIILQGDLSVLIDDKITRVKGGDMWVAPAGTKRIMMANEDTRYIVIHGTHERDLEKIEEQFIAQNEQEYIEYCGQMKLLEGTGI